MKIRIAIWSSVGAIVVVFWTFYMSATLQKPSKVVWTLVHWTCPVALAHQYVLSFYLVVLVNAATYALAGVAFEAIRRQYRNA